MEEPHLFQSGQDTLSAVWHRIPKPDAPIVLLHHGFNGTKTEQHRMFVKQSRQLADVGIESFRFDFYGSGDSLGNLTDATLSHWVKNSLDAASYVQSKGKRKLYSLGFSLGSFVAAVSASQIKPMGLVLWAPIFNPLKRILREGELVVQAKKTGFADYKGELVSMAIVEDAAKFKLPQVFEGDPLPVLLCRGSKDADAPAADFASFKGFYTKNGFSVDTHIIQDADHHFERHDWETELLDKTTQWLKKIG